MAPVLDVKDLRIRFHSDFGDRIVTDDVSFQVREGETLGIVGESGCGKSVTSLAVMGLLPRNGTVDKGSAMFEGKDLLSLPAKELDRIRGKDITMIFQDALASLNPVLTAGWQVTESIRRHVEPDRAKARVRALKLFEQVQIHDPEAVMKKFPHELSGGLRQRVMIAMALSCGPKLLIADEPTTALDVTIQAQIMQTIRQVKQQMNMSMILITHDIGLVAQMADRILVMYAGQFIEEADVYELFTHPLHPYTRALLAAAPGIDDEPGRVLASIPGTVPEVYSDIPGCRFADRCAFAGPECRSKVEMTDVGNGHMVRCLHVPETKGGRAADGK